MELSEKLGENVLDYILIPVLFGKTAECLALTSPESQ